MFSICFTHSFTCLEEIGMSSIMNHVPARKSQQSDTCRPGHLVRFSFLTQQRAHRLAHFGSWCIGLHLFGCSCSGQKRIRLAWTINGRREIAASAIISLHLFPFSTRVDSKKIVCWPFRISTCNIVVSDFVLAFHIHSRTRKCSTEKSYELIFWLPISFFYTLIIYLHIY
jgi:hypothetical protein